MQYQCIDCESKFHDTDQTNQEQRNGLCPSCGSEDLKVIEVLLEVDAFGIELETLSDADWNRSNWRMEEARIKVIETVIKNLTIEDRNRFRLYQERNNPCKEVE